MEVKTYELRPKGSNVSTFIEDRSPICGEIMKTYCKPAEDEISATMKTRDLRVGVSEKSGVGAMTSAKQITIFNDLSMTPFKKGLFSDHGQWTLKKGRG